MKIADRRTLLAIGVVLIAVLLLAYGVAGHPFLVASVATGQTAPGYLAGVGMSQLAPVLKQVTQEGGSSWGAPSRGYSSYVKIADDHEVMRIDVPTEWADIERGLWTYEGRQVGGFLTAARDLYGFDERSSAPGVFFGASRDLAEAYDEEAILAIEHARLSAICTARQRFTYDDPFYHGFYDYYAGCTGDARGVIVAAVAPTHRQVLVLLRIVLTSRADLDAAAKILETFEVLGNPEEDFHHEH